MELRKFIATSIREYLNEQNEVENNLNNNFRRWFSGSKMIQGGTPTIFYHFSNEIFNSFNRKSGINTHLFSTEVVNREAFFFTTDTNFASQYGSKKYEVYLKINNIFDFNKHYFYKDISPTTSDFFDGIIDSIEANDIDMTMEYQSYRGELKIKPEHNWKFFDGEIGRLFVNYLKNNGYDGVLFIEEGSPIYVVFNSNQIKSVENDGTWDVGDDNIYS